MAIQVMCPSCGRRQPPAIRVQVLPPSARDQVTAMYRYDPRRSMLILLLALSIVGMPLAYWLCRRDEALYPLAPRSRVKYSYQCSVCGYAWSRVCEEEVAPQAPASAPDRRTQPVLPSAHENSRV